MSPATGSPEAKRRERIGNARLEAQKAAEGKFQELFGMSPDDFIEKHLSEKDKANLEAIKNSAGDEDFDDFKAVMNFLGNIKTSPVPGFDRDIKQLKAFIKKDPSFEHLRLAHDASKGVQ